MINSLKYQQMQAAGASYNVNPFAGEQRPNFNQKNNEEINIFAADGKTSSVDGLSSITAGSHNGGIGAVQKATENTGIVDRLDRMDASTIKPDSRDALRGKHLYLEG